MKLFHNGHYIKLIPGKFYEINGLVDHLEDEDYKRLTSKERENLKAALFCQRVANTIVKYLSKNEPLVLEHVGNATPRIVYKVTTNDSQVYYVLKFNNNVSIRCSEKLYRISPNKGKLKYANGLGQAVIPPPTSEQLQLFTQNQHQQTVTL